jgi:hypothetical protein
LAGATGSQDGAQMDDAPLRTAVLLAAFRCTARARGGAFADERRMETGECGRSSNSQGRRFIDDRARPWSRRSPRVCRFGTLAGAMAHQAGDRTDYRLLHAGALAATFHCAAPAQCGRPSISQGRRSSTSVHVPVAPCAAGLRVRNVCGRYRPRGWRANGECSLHSRRAHRHLSLLCARG